MTDYLNPVKAWALIDRHNPEIDAGYLKETLPRTLDSENWFYTPVTITSAEWYEHQWAEFKRQWALDGKPLAIQKIAKAAFDAAQPPSGE